MGVINKFKTAAKNVDSYAGEAVDKSKYKSKIKEANNEIEKLEKKLGKLYYASFKGDLNGEEDLAKICKDIDDLYEKIKDYEASINEVSESAKKERADIKAEAEAIEKAEAEAKAEAKAEKAKKNS